MPDTIGGAAGSRGDTPRTRDIASARTDYGGETRNLDAQRRAVNSGGAPATRYQYGGNPVSQTGYNANPPDNAANTSGAAPAYRPRSRELAAAPHYPQSAAPSYSQARPAPAQPAYSGGERLRGEVRETGSRAGYSPDAGYGGSRDLLPRRGYSNGHIRPQEPERRDAGSSERPAGGNSAGYNTAAAPRTQPAYAPGAVRHAAAARQEFDGEDNIQRRRAPAPPRETGAGSSRFPGYAPPPPAASPGFESKPGGREVSRASSSENKPGLLDFANLLGGLGRKSAQPDDSGTNASASVKSANSNFPSFFGGGGNFGRSYGGGFGGGFGGGGDSDSGGDGDFGGDGDDFWGDSKSGSPSWSKKSSGKPASETAAKKGKRGFSYDDDDGFSDVNPLSSARAAKKYGSTADKDAYWEKRDADLGGMPLDTNYYFNYAGALAAASAALERNPRDDKALIIRSNAYLGLGNYARAAEDARAALRINPSSAAGHIALSKCLLAQNKPHEALMEASSAVAADPNSPQALLAQSAAAEQAGDYQMALSALRKAAELDEAAYGQKFQDAIAAYGSKAPEFLVYAKNNEADAPQAPAKSGLPAKAARAVAGLAVFAVIGYAAAKTAKVAAAKLLARRHVLAPPAKLDASAMEIPAPAAAPLPGIPSAQSLEAPLEAALEIGAGASQNHAARVNPALVARRDEEPDDFKIAGRIGAGSTGVVHEGRDARTGAKTAVKEFTVEMEQPVLEAFRDRMEKIASVNHPNLPHALHVGVHNGQLWMVSSFIEGQTLEERLAQRPLSAREAAGIFGGAASALNALHQAGLANGTMHLSDVRITEDRQAMLTDAGIGAVIDRGDPNQTAAPEGAGTRQADIYSLGVCLYESLTRQAPDPSAPVKPSGLAPDIPPEMDEAVLKAIAPRPEDRYAGAADFADALAKIA
ncbi:MAG: protein kinase [Elusimicrobiales bacterium]